MNKKQLAKLLIKHPEIKALYESQAFDTSTINKVIAEEIMKEQDGEDPVEAFFGKKLEQMSDVDKKDAIQKMKEERSTLMKTQKSLAADIRAFGMGDYEEEIEELAQKKDTIAKILKALQTSVDEKVVTALKTETAEDDKQVAQEISQLNKELEKVKHGTAGAKQSIDASKIEGASEEGRQTMKDTANQQINAAVETAKAAAEQFSGGNAANASNNAEENAANAQNNGEETGESEIDSDLEGTEDDGMAATIQKYAESSSNYLSNVALASAGTALVAPPSAPITLPVSKLAGWAGTAADVVALGAAIVNDDKEGMMKNGAATAIGVGAFFIPGGEGAKLLGKEAATETVKVAAKEGAEAVTKEISKEVAEQIAKEAGVQVAELATREVTEQAIKAATEEVAKKAIIQTVAKGAITKAGKNIYAQAKRDELLPDGVFTSKSGEEFSEEELRQIGEAAIQKTAKKTAEQLDNKIGDDFKSVTDQASEQVGMLDKIKSFFGFGSEATEDAVIDATIDQEEAEELENNVENNPMTQEQENKIKDGLRKIFKGNDWPRQYWTNDVRKEVFGGKGDNNRIGNIVTKKLQSSLKKAFMLASRTIGIEQIEYEDILPYLIGTEPTSKISQAAASLPKIGDQLKSHDEFTRSEPLKLSMKDSAVTIKKFIEEAISISKQKAQELGIAGPPSAQQGGEENMDSTATSEDTPTDAASGDELPNDGESADQSTEQDASEPSDVSSSEKDDSQASPSEPRNIESDDIITKTLQSLGSNVEDFPELLVNDRFKSLLSKALQDAGADESENLVDDDLGSSETSLEESLSGIYLAEEDDPTPTQGDQKTGKPLSTDEASGLFAEIQKMQELFDGQDKLKTINVMDLAKQAGMNVSDEEVGTDDEEEPALKTTEEAQQDGNEAADVDSQKESATFADTYAKLIPSMDNFFSTEQATKLGFMEQFLLQSQSAMLWDLIGNLTEIAEKGKARAFTKRKEKEESDISGEGSVEAEETMQEGIGDFFKRDKEPVEISKEDQISLKTDLKALLQTLRATKVMVTSYEKNMTRVSVDPGLDGSALKEQLDQYLPMVQKSIAKIVERANEAFVKATKLNAPKEEPEVTQPAEGDNAEEMDQDQMVEAILEAIAPALDGMHGLQEDNGRDETINFVDSVYNEMRAIYAPVAAGEDSEGLRGFMEAGNRAKAIKQAEAMLELATKEDFIKLFPGGRIGEGGMPATVKGAIGTLTREIKKLVMIMRDVVTLASKSTIPHSKLVEIVSSLTTISKALYNSFGAKMMISGETLEQIEERLGKDENNKSLTDTPSKPGLMDKVKQFGSKLFNKIKSWFQNNAGDVLNYLGDKFLDLFATKIEESGLDEDEQEEILTAMVEIVSWFDSLDNEKKIAVGMFGNNLIRIRGINEVSIPSIKKLGDEIETDKKKVLQAFMDLSKEQQSIIEDVMRTEREDLVNYLKEILRIKEKLGDEVAKELVGPTFGDDAGTSDDLSDEKPESDKQPTPNKVEQSLGWYQELEGSEREAAQAFATNFLNSLRKSNKVSYLVSESFSRRFSEKLAEIFDVEDLVDEMNQAINSVDGDLRKRVIKLMKESPEEFAAFVYDLSTSDELGDKIFGEPEKKNSLGLPPELVKSGAKYRELENLIGKVDKFFEKFYFGKSYEVRSTQMDLEELRGLEKQKKNVFLDWVWSIDKRLKKLSLKESEDKEHPADKMIKRIKAITKINIETSDFLDIINNALTDAVKRNDKGDSGSNNSLRSYWIGKINENPGKMAFRLGYFLNVYREHDINGLLELSSGKLSRSKPEEIEKMYLKVKNFDDGDDASGDGKKDKFDVQNVKPWNKSNPYKFGKKDSVEESLKPIIQKMLKEHYNY